MDVQVTKIFYIFFEQFYTLKCIDYIKKYSNKYYWA